MLCFKCELTVAYDPESCISVKCACNLIHQLRLFYHHKDCMLDVNILATKQMKLLVLRKTTGSFVFSCLQGV